MNIGVVGNVELRVYSNLGILKMRNSISNTITSNLAQGIIEKILYSTSSLDITPRYILRASTRGDYELNNFADYKEAVKITESNDSGKVYQSDRELGRSASFRFMIPSQFWLGDQIASLAISTSSIDKAKNILAIVNLDAPITKSPDSYLDIRWNFNVIKGGE